MLLSILYSQSDNTLYQVGCHPVVIPTSQQAADHFLTFVQCFLDSAWIYLRDDSKYGKMKKCTRDGFFLSQRIFNNQIFRMMKILVTKGAISVLCLTILSMACSVKSFGQVSTHTCGAEDVHNPAIAFGKATDIDGNSYKTVVIDDLVWFAENLKVTRFQNGDVIPNVSETGVWSALTGPGMCSYKNDTSYDCPRGKLYNFFVAADARNPCPNGWRVPSLTDLYQLIFFLDPNANPQQPGNMPNTAGGALKSSGLTYWRSPNTNATNLFGFSAIPNGGRNDAGVFSFSNDAAASYWLSTQVGPGMGFFLELAYPQDYAVRNAYFAKYGCCIRCVADLNTLSAGENKAPHFTIFPNPADDYIQINSDQWINGEEYIISDLTGRVVLAGRILSDNTTISVTDLPPGMYFLILPKTNGGVSKIIKQ